ncbi:unnamed protein product, partial [Rotaria magnacalcarata]
MAYSPLPAPDILTIQELIELTSTNEKIIDFSQQLGLLYVYPTQPCSKQHDD